MTNPLFNSARPKRRSTRRAGFTLVEIMIVVLIIGILMAIAVPNFVNAREKSRKNSCISSLRKIEAAKEQWSMDNRKTEGAAVVWTDLTPNYLKAQPVCPSGGAYTLGNVGTDATCNKTGHAQ